MLASFDMPRVSMTLKNGSMTPSFWVMNPFFKGQKETPGLQKAQFWLRYQGVESDSEAKP